MSEVRFDPPEKLPHEQLIDIVDRLITNPPPGFMLVSGPEDATFFQVDSIERVPGYMGEPTRKVERRLDNHRPVVVRLPGDPLNGTPTLSEYHLFASADLTKGHVTRFDYACPDPEIFQQISSAAIAAVAGYKSIVLGGFVSKIESSARDAAEEQVRTLRPIRIKTTANLPEEEILRVVSELEALIPSEAT